MNTNHIVIFLSLCFLLLFIACKEQTNKTYNQPIETLVKLDMEDGSTRDLKKAWLAKIHQSAPEDDWQTIEHGNMIKRYARVKNAQQRNGREIIAEGALVGDWIERGSINQAGSVFATTYNPSLDELFLISAGGILFKGDTGGRDWMSANDLLRFDERFLTSFKEGDDLTLISSIRGLPYFSKDKGKSWTAANGISEGSQKTRKWVHLQSKNHLFLLHKKDFWSDIQVYFSSDGAQNFVEVLTINTTDLNNVTICNPHNTSKVVLMEQIATNQSKRHIWDENTQGFVEQNEIANLAWGGNGRANLIGSVDGADTVYYSYKKDRSLWKATNSTINWVQIAELPKEPWEVGVYLSKENPKLLLMGEVEGYRSIDGGITWELLNNWWEYYDNIQKKLHADIMFFSEYKDYLDRNVILVSNHGGISTTYDEAVSFDNIAKRRLNVSQYYDVKSHPENDLWLYAGSQDQGFQRGFQQDDQEKFDLDQVISGDYGHIAFTKNNQSLWMVYPGGQVYYYDNAYGELTSSWNLESLDESVWIPPLVASPDPNANTVYLAGGNENGGTGSYLIRLTANQFGDIIPEQLDFNFMVNNSGTISAIDFNRFNPNIIYVATTNGAFFISEDNGERFIRKQFDLPGSHYLYGSDIYPSKTDPNTIYISGSGYSNSAVVVSYDGGESFEDLDNGLPRTLAFELAGDNDERFIFTATEAGPYVFIVEEQRWYHMGGTSAPSQTYWSLEYLEKSNRVRFGTYGRGVWDFAINNDVMAAEETAKEFQKLVVYPNPAEHIITIEIEEPGLINILDSEGRLVDQVYIEDNFQYNIDRLPHGIYYLLSVDGKQKGQFIKSR